MSQSRSTVENQIQGSFRKEIGVFGGISIIGGIMIGSGIFYLGSYVLERTGMSTGMALLCWIIGGLVSLLGGLCFAELGASDPKSGAEVRYLSRAFHPSLGYSYGFTCWLLSGSGSIAALAIALPTAFRNFWDISDAAVKVIAVLLIIVLTAYNCLGIREGSILQNVFMVAKLIPILIILVAGLVMGKQHVDLSLIPAGTDASFGSVISMIAFATVATLWAYEGWTNLNPVAEEMKDPGRDLPKALILGIGGITVIYTLFNFAIYKVLPHEQIVAMIEREDLYLGTAAAGSILGSAGAALIFLTQIVAIFGCLNGMIIAFARYYHRMAEDGHFFRSQGILSARGIPRNALLSQAVISIVLVMLRNLDELTSLVVFSGMMYNVLVILAVIIYRKKYPDLERPYQIPGYPFTVILTAVIFTALMINTLIEDQMTAVLGLAVPMVGILIWFVIDRKRKREH